MRCEVMVGDVRNIPLADASVHLAVTSPPYWSLRDYGVEPSVWGGDPECAPAWQDRRCYREGGGGATSSAEAFTKAGPGNAARIKAARWREDSTCAHCNAWLGALGLEPTPELYIEHLVECCREIRRVLRPDGCFLLNLGDSYAASGGAGSQYGVKHRRGIAYDGQKRIAPPKSKPKDKLMVPHRAAIALQADGWWCRADVPWVKRNGMPESVTDSPATSHEYWFLLTRSPRYYWDAGAIRAPYTQASIDRSAYMYGRGPAAAIAKSPDVGDGSGHYAPPNPAGRNFRTSDLVLAEDGLPLVQVCNTRGYPGAHFATFPPARVEPWVRAACPARVCAACEAPWRQGRVKVGERNRRWSTQNAEGSPYNQQGSTENVYEYADPAPSCQCGGDEWVPGLVIDPFAGAGTVGLVAAQEGRRFVGFECCEEYVRQANQRLRAAEGSTVHPDGSVSEQLSMELHNGG